MEIKMKKRNKYINKKNENEENKFKKMTEKNNYEKEISEISTKIDKDQESKIK